MLTKERKRTDNFTPSLSPEAWAALKLASMSGTSDKDLADVYEVTETSIRIKRSRDKLWAVSVGLRNQALGKNGNKSKHLRELKEQNPDTERNKEVEKQTIGAIVATFADENQAARLLALQIGKKGLQASLHGDGSLKAHLEPTEPAHVKTYADILKTAGSWGSDTQITVNCQAYAGASIASLNSESEETIVDL